MNPDIAIKRRSYLISKKIQVLIDKIMDMYGLDEWTIISDFYRSELYCLLSDEDTKVWWFSTPALYEIYRYELENKTLCGAPYINDLIA